VGRCERSARTRASVHIIHRAANSKNGSGRRACLRQAAPTEICTKGRRGRARGMRAELCGRLSARTSKDLVTAQSGALELTARRNQAFSKGVGYDFKVGGAI